MSDQSMTDSSSESGPDATVWRVVREALRGLQYGSITLVVQDGVVIQLDRHEKTRLRRERQR